MKMIPVDGVKADVSFGKYDPADWRNHPEPPDMDSDDDDDLPTPEDVIFITGIDPKAEGW